MEIHETDFIYKLWQAALVSSKVGREGDWQCILLRRASDSSLEGEYRFRYYNSAGFDVPDDKKFYQLFCGPDTEASQEIACVSIRKMLTAGIFEDVREHDVNGDYRKLREALMNDPNTKLLVTHGVTK